MKIIIICKYTVAAIFLSFAVLITLIFGMGKNIAVYKAMGKNFPIYCVDTDNKKVAVTFDTAWGNEDIDKIIQNLAKHDCKATFFVTGEWARKFPKDVLKLYNAGHEIANHSNNHEHFKTLSISQMEESIKKGEEAIKKITGQKTVLFRAPYGEYNNSLILHDPDVGRISNGKGFIKELTLSELRGFDTGKGFNKYYKGLSFPTFEDVLKKFACHIIMNIHIKLSDDESEYSHVSMKKIVDLIYKYNCEKYVYFMGTEPVMRTAIKIAPSITRCMGAGHRPWEIVERGIEFGCKKVQLFKPNFNQDMIDKAHNKGIICNVFYADNAEEAIKYKNMGIDTILTNNYFEVARAIKV